MSKAAVKKTQYKKLDKKVDNLEKTPNVSTLPQTSQNNTDKQNPEKQIGEVQNKIPDVSGLVTTTVFITKIGEVETKIPNLVEKVNYDAKTLDIERNTLLLLIIINLRVT